MILNETFLVKPIVENSDAGQLPQGVLCRVTYPVCNIGERNANNRVYEAAVWEGVFGDAELMGKIKERALFGHAEHPEQTQSNLEKTSHVIFEMWEDNGTVYQKVDVLDTPTGRIVETLLRAGCKVGMSTRADGDLEESEDAEGTYLRVVPESYNYVTTDFTADPSTFGAVPKNVRHNIAQEARRQLKIKGLHDHERQFATLIVESMIKEEEVVDVKKRTIKECIKDGTIKEGTVISVDEKRGGTVTITEGSISLTLAGETMSADGDGYVAIQPDGSMFLCPDPGMEEDYPMADPMVDPMVADPMVDPMVADPMVDPMAADPMVDPTVGDMMDDEVVDVLAGKDEDEDDEDELPESKKADEAVTKVAETKVDENSDTEETPVNEDCGKELPALRDLHAKANLVLNDISDKDTGWFYQFQAATQNAGKVVRMHDDGEETSVPESKDGAEVDEGTDFTATMLRELPMRGDDEIPAVQFRGTGSDDNEIPNHTKWMNITAETAPTMIRWLQENFVNKDESVEESVAEADDFVDLQISEASMRAERDKAVELLEATAAESTDADAAWKRDRRLEVTMLGGSLKEAKAARAAQVAAMGDIIVEREGTIGTLTVQLKEKTGLVESHKGDAEKATTNLSEDITKLEKSRVSEATQHETALKTLQEAHDKKTATKVDEAKAEVGAEVTGDMIKSFIQIRVSESSLRLSNNSRTLLEECKTLAEVDSLLDEIVEGKRRRSALRTDTSERRTIRKPQVDSETRAVKRTVESIFEGME